MRLRSITDQTAVTIAAGNDHAEHAHSDGRLIPAAGIAVQQGIDAEHVPSDPTDDRFKRHDQCAQRGRGL